MTSKTQSFSKEQLGFAATWALVARQKIAIASKNSYPQVSQLTNSTTRIGKLNFINEQFSFRISSAT